MKDEKDKQGKIRPRRGMLVATVTEMIGEGVGGGEGRVVRREMVVNRTSEGEVTLSAKSAALIATFVVANMVVSVVTRPPSSQR